MLLVTGKLDGGHKNILCKTHLKTWKKNLLRFVFVSIKYTSRWPELITILWWRNTSERQYGSRSHAQIQDGGRRY